MKIVLVVPMRDEIKYGNHVYLQMDSALKMDYDEIIVLDDGSRDGTWDVLKEYEKKDNRVKLLRNEINSIISKGENRWKTLVDYAATFEPTWIHFRAADQLHSKIYNKEMRKIVEYFHYRGARIIKFPLAHLWRSKWWYRVDHVWGSDIHNHNKSQLWRFDKSYVYDFRRSQAKFHGGLHLPSNARYPRRYIKNINDYVANPIGKEFNIVVLHYGHTTHEKKEVKFRLTMETASKGISIACPCPSDMPPVKNWLRYNGYKGFWEFNMILSKCPQIWFEEPIPENPEKPNIKSFYNVINEFRSDRANEYRYLFNTKPKYIIK